MMTDSDLEILFVTPPGLENELRAEATEKHFRDPRVISGGVTVRGDWTEAWRANLQVRGASKVLVRFASFRALHLAQLDKRAHKVPWADILRPDVPVKVEATCAKSRIYHAGATRQRIADAIQDTVGAPISAEADVCIKVRIEDDVCTISLDTSGEGLHKRGHKVAVNKAPLRETMAALFLRACGYDGHEPVVDPMCGSGTIPIEAAEIAAGLWPGRSRSFAFEKTVPFDGQLWQQMRDSAPALPDPATIPVRFYGSDRDEGAIRMGQANAERAGLTPLITWTHQTISDLRPPDGPVGLVLINPPYGTRLGDKKKLIPLYRAIGQTLRDHFSGWRVGIITSEPGLARATGLPFARTTAPVPHGGLRITLSMTQGWP